MKLKLLLLSASLAILLLCFLGGNPQSNEDNKSTPILKFLNEKEYNNVKLSKMSNGDFYFTGSIHSLEDWHDLYEYTAKIYGEELADRYLQNIMIKEDIEILESIGTRIGIERFAAEAWAPKYKRTYIVGDVKNRDEWETLHNEIKKSFPNYSGSEIMRHVKTQDNEPGRKARGSNVEN